jgi:two-component system response regulator AlgR
LTAGFNEILPRHNAATRDGHDAVTALSTGGDIGFDHGLKQYHMSVLLGQAMCLRRILVVDDNPTFLAAVVSLLPTIEGIEVVGTAGSGREALERMAVLEPDLVLMDLAMPGMNGLEAARHLAALPRRPRVVLMTAHEDKAYRVAALKAGADGFLHKSELEDQLMPLIRTLLAECSGDGNPADDQA